MMREKVWESAALVDTRPSVLLVCPVTMLAEIASWENHDAAREAVNEEEGRILGRGLSVVSGWKPEVVQFGGKKNHVDTRYQEEMTLLR